MSATNHQGFSAVELLITIIVGMVFIGAISQMYTVVVNDASATRNKANASSIAYVQLRAIAADLASGTCVAKASVTLPVDANAAAPDLSSLPTPRTITAAIDCPYTATYSNSAISRITVTVSYGKNSPQDKVKHVLYKY